ncbi:hypothetical protein B0T19DRAFT_454485 [Cercophora scortea]|uniref:Uncharacterized protein n=1 Tax=Cercophora scortea TaxID=314031 RepID=A0AAE0MLW2_9PEZI|nr:hypothetical protein B0T19DRAFT_454485 [Cercophora scortea]
MRPTTFLRLLAALPLAAVAVSTATIPPNQRVALHYNNDDYYYDALNFESDQQQNLKPTATNKHTHEISLAVKRDTLAYAPDTTTSQQEEDDEWQQTGSTFSTAATEKKAPNPYHITTNDNNRNHKPRNRYYRKFRRLTKERVTLLKQQQEAALAEMDAFHQRELKEQRRIHNEQVQRIVGPKYQKGIFSSRQRAILQRLSGLQYTDTYLLRRDQRRDRMLLVESQEREMKALVELGAEKGGESSSMYTGSQP